MIHDFRGVDTVHALGFLVALTAGALFTMVIGAVHRPYPSTPYFAEAFGAGLPYAALAALVVGFIRLMFGPVQPVPTWIVAAAVSVGCLGYLVLRGTAV